MVSTYYEPGKLQSPSLWEEAQGINGQRVTVRCWKGKTAQGGCCYPHYWDDAPWTSLCKQVVVLSPFTILENITHSISQKMIEFLTNWLLPALKSTSKIEQWSEHYQKSKGRDFPGGAMVKNPPANAGDTGLIPGPGRSHMPRSN